MARIKFEKKELPKLPIDKLLSLKNVFLKQQWEIDEGRANSRFTKYINLLNNLQNDEQGLILELSERFTVIEQNNYLNEIITAINNLITAFPEVKQYYVLPVLAREDIGTTEVKSSHTISYLFKGDQIETKIDIEGRNFRVVKDINNFKSRTTAFKTHEKILFVDDFIGSGETAKEAVEILDGMDVKTSEIAFLSIVAHKTGVERLEKDSYKVFFSRLATRGISDFYLEETERILKTEQMARIEDRIPKIEDKYRFGYNQCEALVCMQRMPNNTFPIYWLHKGVSPYKR